MRTIRFLLPALLLVTWQAWAAGFGCGSGFPIAITEVPGPAASLFWQVPVGTLPSGPVSYAIFKGVSPASLSQIARTSTPFFRDAGILAATTYYYLILASSNGVSASGSNCLTTSAPPPAPSNVLAVANSNSTVTLTWAEDITSTSVAIARFTIYRGTSPSNLAQIAVVKAVSYVNQVSPGTTYYYGIQAFDVEGNSSALSTIASVTTPE